MSGTSSRRCGWKRFPTLFLCSALPLLALAGGLTAFRFHFPPKNVVGNASRLFDLAAGLVEKRLELG